MRSENTSKTIDITKNIRSIGGRMSGDDGAIGMSRESELQRESPDRSGAALYFACRGLLFSTLDYPLIPIESQPETAIAVQGE